MCGGGESGDVYPEPLGSRVGRHEGGGLLARAQQPLDRDAGGGRGGARVLLLSSATGVSECGKRREKRVRRTRLPLLRHPASVQQDGRPAVRRHQRLNLECGQLKNRREKAQPQTHQHVSLARRAGHGAHARPNLGANRGGLSGRARAGAPRRLRARTKAASLCLSSPRHSTRRHSRSPEPSARSGSASAASCFLRSSNCSTFHSRRCSCQQPRPKATRPGESRSS